MGNAAVPVVQPQAQPQVFVEMPSAAPRQGASAYGAGAALSVALAAAGLGVVAGRQAMLFTTNKGRPGSGQKKPEKFTATSANNVGEQRRNATRDQSVYQKKGYLAGRNNQTQRNGFGTFVQKFQTVGGKSKYGVPIFLANGNVNPAYLAAERAEIQAKSKLNTVKAEKKRKDLIKQGKFQLADYIKKAIGDVGSNAEYYQSGR
jgi:hypothetical protein